jgi:hypothetical protein
VFAESDLDVGQKFFSDDQRGRFVFERIVRRFVDEIPLIILRPGWIVGEGELLCRIAHVLLAMTEPPPRQVGDRMILTDIESLATIIASLDGGGAVRSGTTLHLAGAPPLSLGESSAIVMEVAARLVPPGYDLAAGARRVLRKGDEESWWSPKELSRRQVPSARFASEQTGEFLRDRGLVPPRVDRDKLVPLVERAVEEIVGFR